MSIVTGYQCFPWAGGHLFPNNTKRARSALAARFGPQVADFTRLPKNFCRPVVLSNVLILAREDVIAALLGLMVELRGMQPHFIAEGESLATALGKGHLPVLIDCDHPDCNAETFELIRRHGGEPILFSPFRLQSEVTRLASRYNTRSFTLPTDPDTFGRLLKT